MNSLDRLLIERECERLVMAYCHYVDRGRAGEVADLFCDEGIWDSGEREMVGREAIARAFLQRQENSGRISRHVCTNLLIEVIDAETATGVVYLTLYRHDGPPDRKLAPSDVPAMIGEYRDRFVRTSDGWRFQRRDVKIDFAKGRPS
jgi:hypothetical protein